jgi:hypothetical protein
MRRANEYRDAGVLLFEPRLLDAEREADSIAKNSTADSRAASIARICIEDFRLYRKSLNLANRGYLAREGMDDARANVDACLVTLGGYL